MKTYAVLVNRIGHSRAQFKVEAADEAEAMKLALSQAHDYEFSEHDSDYEVGSVCETRGKEITNE